MVCRRRSSGDLIGAGIVTGKARLDDQAPPARCAVVVPADVITGCPDDEVGLISSRVFG